jgi:hypothetical protein
MHQDERELVAAQPGRQIGWEASTAANEELFVDFSAEAVGEFLPGSKYRILDLKPGRFDE